MDPKTKWLIKAYLPEDSLVMLYGEPGTFKSFIALDWALSVATGRSWLGAACARKRAVYVSAEGQRGIAQRVAAWLEHNHVKPEDAERLVFVTSPVAVPDVREFSAFLSELAAFVHGEAEENPEPLGLIVFDTVARCFGGLDENSTRDMGLFVKACDLLRLWFPGLTVLLVHHSGLEETHRARGSIALTGATDAAFATAKRNGKRIELRNPRNKDNDELTPRPLLMLPVDISLVVTASDEALIETTQTEANDAARDMLRFVPEEGIRYAAWYRLSGLSPSTFARYLRWLKRQDLIKLTSNYYHRV